MQRLVEVVDMDVEDKPQSVVDMEEEDRWWKEEDKAVVVLVVADRWMGMMDRVMKRGKLWEVVDGKKLQVVVAYKGQMQAVDKRQEEVRNIGCLNSCTGVPMEHNLILVFWRLHNAL